MFKLLKNPRLFLLTFYQIAVFEYTWAFLKGHRVLTKPSHASDLDENG
jgi:hypothetical protein